MAKKVLDLLKGMARKAKAHERRESRSMERKEHKGQGKVGKVMEEYEKGELHSGSKEGPKVTNPKQAVAIALSEAGMSKKKRM